MTRYTLTILEEHRAALQKSLLRDGKEYAAMLICGRSTILDPWMHDREERFLVREVVEVENGAFSERSATGLTWSTTPFYNALKQVEARNFAVAAVHSHPDGPLCFSPRDDVAEKELFAIAFNRLESVSPHLSIIMDGQGNLIARCYGPDLNPRPVSFIRVVGKRWRYWYSKSQDGNLGRELDRQLRTFGRESTLDLGQLRIGIVGCGGMGSAVAAMLCRTGIRQLFLIDPDRVDETNLNRLHYSTRKDANLGRLKVDVLGEAMASLGFPISIVRKACHVDDISVRDDLRSCDVIFGCTDDHLGRNLLNRLAHFYLIPIIDLGLLIEPNETGGYDVFDGRVTVVQPGYPCQICRGLIRSTIMLGEGLQRRDPVLYEQRRQAGYIPGAPDPSPVVVTFSTEVAAMAVNELFQRLNGFRGMDGECAERVRRFDEVKDTDTLPLGKSRSGCRLCDQRKYDGRGDMEPFLDMTT